MVTGLVAEYVEIVEDLTGKICGRRLVADTVRFGLDWLGGSLLLRQMLIVVGAATTVRRRSRCRRRMR